MKRNKLMYKMYFESYKKFPTNTVKYRNILHGNIFINLDAPNIHN